MRQGQQNNKRPRGRGRKNPNPLTRSYESNGGDVKIRGTAIHVAEKYVQLARDAQASGDRVAGESYLQHAEHYFRIIAAAQAAMPQQPQPVVRSENGEDGGERNDERGGGHRNQQARAPHQSAGQQPTDQQPTVAPNDPQPYANGSGPDTGGQTDMAEAANPEAGAPVSTEPGEAPAQPEQRRGRGTRGPRRRQPYRDRTGEANGRQDAGGAQPQPAPAEPQPSSPDAEAPPAQSVTPPAEASQED